MNKSYQTNITKFYINTNSLHPPSSRNNISLKLQFGEFICNSCNLPNIFNVTQTIFQVTQIIFQVTQTKDTQTIFQITQIKDTKPLFQITQIKDTKTIFQITQIKDTKPLFQITEIKIQLLLSHRLFSRSHRPHFKVTQTYFIALVSHRLFSRSHRLNSRSHRPTSKRSLQLDKCHRQDLESHRLTWHIQILSLKTISLSLVTQTD